MSELNLLRGRIKELEELVEEWEGTAIFNQNCWGRERAVMIDNLQISRSENESLRKDADKWKIVENAMESLKSDERNASIWSVCSRLLISTAHKLNSASSTVTEEGVTVGDVEIGDWRVTVERISSPENP